MPQTHWTHWRTRWALITITGLLVACGGGSSDSDNSQAPSDPLQSYRQQTVQWTECDPSILGYSYDSLNKLQASDRLRCSLITAPLDWANVERGNIVLSVMRLAAGQKDKRRGALLFNPGGPGIDGLSITFRLFEAFDDSSPSSAQGAMQRRLLQEYDMVGFSPRGTGASTRLDCATNEVTRWTDLSAAGWSTPDNLGNIRYNASKSAQACLKNPITPYINTDASARDLDLLRGLLGDERLNYVGYSYGTWLGAWYASLFPEKVGRMVLDSAMNFSTHFDQMNYTQTLARQRLLDEVLVPYAVRHADYFHLGASDAQVRAIMPSLSPKMQVVLARRLSGLGYSRNSADPYLGYMAAARGLDQELKALADPLDEAAVQAALQAHTFDPAIDARNMLLREVANGLYRDYLNLWVKPSDQSIALDSKAAVFAATSCNDSTPSITDQSTWLAKVQSLASQAPMFFQGLLLPEILACAYWDGPRVKKPDPAALQNAPLLFVQSQYDTATATEGADAFFAQLPAARRVYVRGDFQHGVYPYGDDCVDPVVTRYLLGETPAQREAICPGLPLLQDMPQTSRASAAPAREAMIFNNPRQAEKHIEEFKRAISPSLAPQ